MPSIAPAPSRQHVLSWERPLLAAAVEWLAEGWSGGSVLDLADTIIVVPTRQSARRLRQALAAHAAVRGQAVFPPRVVQPEQVLELATPASAPAVASRAAVLLAWVQVLQTADLDSLRAVFPVDPPQRSFRWALQLAEDFGRLQEILAEGGLRFGDVTARSGDAFVEEERWAQLAELERRFDEVLESGSGRAPAAAQRATAAAPAGPPVGIRRVVLLATPDPRPLVLAVLSAWMREVEVLVARYAAPADAARFDAWGRPRPEAWTEEPLRLGPFEACVRVCPDPAAQAEAVARWAHAYAGREGVCALGCADPELVPRLETALAAQGLTPYLPQGELLQRHALAGLIEALLLAVRDEAWEPVAALARHAAVLDWLGRAIDGFSSARWLAGLDELQTRHLPPNLDEARRHAHESERLARFPALAAALDRVAALIGGLRTGRFPAAWDQALAGLFAGQVLETTRPEDQALMEVAEAWRTASAAVGQAAPADLPAADACHLSLRLLGASRRFVDKPAGAVEVDGWLELLFRDEPHLLVAGCNDGCVPEAITGHAFLPETLREHLGLRTNSQRLARDAWQLAALAASRSRSGRLDLFLGRASATGDPLRPSRLLLLCGDDELPARVAWLFRELPPPGQLVSWQRAWRLRPRQEPPPAKLRVTAFRDYLRCPFRFYLKHVLRLESVETDKRELDARDFGELVHRVLERLGRDADWRDATDDRALAAGFSRELDRLVATRYGGELALPLIVQIESARQRLTHAARIQAAARRDGWVIEHVEWPFPPEGLVLAGLTVSGMIDRIERHADTGRWRVLDYKTGESALAPASAHVRPRGWVDLQLPLYRWAVREALGAEDVELGYFNLPKAVSETAIMLWEEYDEDLHRAALECAGSAAQAIAAGRFWPPVEDVPHDEFAALFHHGAADSVVWREEG